MFPEPQSLEPHVSSLIQTFVYIASLGNLASLSQHMAPRRWRAHHPDLRNLRGATPKLCLKIEHPHSSFIPHSTFLLFDSLLRRLLRTAYRLLDL